MKSNGSTRSVSSGLKMLVIASLSVLQACQTTSILTTGQVPAEAEARIAAQVCRLFPNQTHDSTLDTKLTSDQIKAFNRARDAYCKEK